MQDTNAVPVPCGEQVVYVNLNAMYRVGGVIYRVISAEFGSRGEVSTFVCEVMNPWDAAGILNIPEENLYSIRLQVSANVIATAAQELLRKENNHGLSMVA